jgi:hypothetical protein
VVESETISTEVTADLDYVEAQVNKAAKALEEKKAEDATRALLQAQVRGVDFRYSREDTPLAEGVPQEFNRNAVRAGLTLALPLNGRQARTPRP